MPKSKVDVHRFDISVTANEKSLQYDEIIEGKRKRTCLKHIHHTRVRSQIACSHQRELGNGTY